MSEIIVAPSILSADWGKLDEEIKQVIADGADWIHMDVMDGHFVPPITFGPQLVKTAKKVSTMPLDVHLMISNPENQIEAFAEAGADFITIHVEACAHLHRVSQLIHELGAKAGVSLNPGTSVDMLKGIIEHVDLVLVMTVNPGWGGQKYIQGSEKKITEIRKLIDETGKDIFLQVDGGITSLTGRLAVNAGANALVAGSFVFGQNDYKAAIDSLRHQDS